MTCAGSSPATDGRCTPEEAREIGEADLAYLERLRDAANEASARHLAPGWALLHAYAVGAAAARH